MWVPRARLCAGAHTLSLFCIVSFTQLGTAAAEVLARDAQQLQSVSSALDGVQSELQLARKVVLCASRARLVRVLTCAVSLCCTALLQLLLRVIKSLYTDKIFLLFVFLVAAVLTCIVVYAGVNKWQL
jgi:choline-glycine betaine transporter